MANSPYRNYPLPSITDSVAEEFFKLQEQTLLLIDGDVHDLMEALSQKANQAHGHTIGQIEGLQAALEGKLDASTPFRLADLTDVLGADDAPDGYILVKVSGSFVVQAAASALGAHGHSINQVTGLETALGQINDKFASYAKKATVSTSAPSGGVDGDVWYQVG